MKRARRSGERATEWWMWGVLPLAGLHAALFFTLQARPGAIAVPLWTWGPPLLIIAAAGLLAGALASSLRGRGTTWPRATAFVSLVALLGTMGPMGVYRAFPSQHDETPSDVRMSLPLDGPVTVAWGGPDRRVNYHVRSPSERWGFDLLVTVNGASHAGSGRSATDYHAYDRPVRAPASGRVVDVVDGIPDAVPGRAEPAHGGGNLIVLEIAEDEYLFLVHLKAGSLRVAPGDVVSRDDVVAHVGNSGNSSEPHLHLHLQDTPAIDRGQAIPFAFTDYVDVETGMLVERGVPEGGVRGGRYVGDIVRRASHP